VLGVDARRRQDGDAEVGGHVARFVRGPALEVRGVGPSDSGDRQPQTPTVRRRRRR
jgi:hypothetical protein